jgi:DNA-binding transcriptional LysR family regulator
MEMQQVRYFVALAGTLNFTKAAEQCNVTQPVLTRAIKALEGEFGGELIRREGRTTHLTELGQQMLPLLRQCLESAQSARLVARSVASGERTSLSIGLSRTVDLNLIQAALREVFRAMPTLRLNLRRGAGDELVELLKAGDIELAIAGPLGAKWERLDQWQMFVEPFEILIGSTHPLAGVNSREIELETLGDCDFLIQSGGEIAEEDSQRLGALGVRLKLAHQVDSDRDLAELVEANMGVALAPRSMLRSAPFTRHDLANVDLRRTVAIYAVAGRPRSPGGATLLNLIRAADWSEAQNRMDHSAA